MVALVGRIDCLSLILRGCPIQTGETDSSLNGQHKFLILKLLSSAGFTNHREDC